MGTRHGARRIRGIVTAVGAVALPGQSGVHRRRRGNTGLHVLCKSALPRLQPHTHDNVSGFQRVPCYASVYIQPGETAMTRMTAKDFDLELLDPYDVYAHG